MNDELPADINLLEVEKAAPHFHARHDAIARSYLYQISRRRSAFAKRLVWWIKDPLRLAAMQECASLFVGTHDFRSFTADDPEEKSTAVAIEEVTLAEEESLILIRVTGSHFLWKQVRQMVGVLAESGRGSLGPAQVRKFLAGDSALPATLTAPPSGLFLERIYYKGDPRRTALAPVIGVPAKEFYAAPPAAPARGRGRRP